MTKNITTKINTPLYNEVWDRQRPADPYRSQPTWFENDEAVLICDRYDIWKIDPTGKKFPVNITNGYGRRNKIVLRCTYPGPSYIPPPPIADKRIVLAAFDSNDKSNGFFWLNLNKQSDPEKIIMSSDIYYFPENFDYVEFPYKWTKARDADVYLLTKESASEFPNLVVTTDFKKFKQISDLAPQKKYNWLTTELISYKTFDGKSTAGILFKPENFDSNKQYPIIFYFYEKFSDGLNKYVSAALYDGPINIPFLVSQGYLVFWPDIHYTLGNSGESIYNYVVSAAKMMGKKPYVDAKRMGIQGHSFGAYEVNYLVTRTNIFAAACSANGMSDYIGVFGSLADGYGDMHTSTENAQVRFNASLWDNRNMYIRASPVLNADKVSTPMLIVHNKQDTRVPERKDSNILPLCVD